MWSTRYASAPLMVAIWMAEMASTPASMAMRTMLSRWPRSSTSLATTSSVQKLTRRAAPGACSSTSRMFSVRKWAKDDSRITMCMPLRSFSRHSWES